MTFIVETDLEGTTDNSSRIIPVLYNMTPVEALIFDLSYKKHFNNDLTVRIVEVARLHFPKSFAIHHQDKHLMYSLVQEEV